MDSGVFGEGRMLLNFFSFASLNSGYKYYLRNSNNMLI